MKRRSSVLEPVEIFGGGQDTGFEHTDTLLAHKPIRQVPGSRYLRFSTDYTNYLAPKLQRANIREYLKYGINVTAMVSHCDH